MNLQFQRGEQYSAWPAEPARHDPGVIRIACAVISDQQGRILLVRKRGTSVFMQPGGKIEAGENPVNTLARELHEEIGVHLVAESVQWLGEFGDSATHEPGRRVNAQVYRCSVAGRPVANAEIEELAWVFPDGPHDLEIARLSQSQILPRLASSFPAAAVRPATPLDSLALAELANIAGEGLPEYVWNPLAMSGESFLQVGQRRACREQGAFSYRNAIVCEIHDHVVACMVGYPLERASTPSNLDDMPALFVPLQQLEDLAIGTWYVNVLATHHSQRGMGYARTFLAIAQARACTMGSNGLSVIVADSNQDARRLYERFGFVESARLPMVKESWKHPGSEWILLIKRSSWFGTRSTLLQSSCHELAGMGEGPT